MTSIEYIVIISAIFNCVPTPAILLLNLNPLLRITIIRFNIAIILSEILTCGKSMEQLLSVLAKTQLKILHTPRTVYAVALRKKKSLSGKW